MNWTKRRITTTRWESLDFLITETETASCDGRPFRLDSPDADSEWFLTLREAKAVAALRYELALFKRDNEQLRAELAERQGRWPDAADAGTVAGPWADAAPEAAADPSPATDSAAAHSGASSLSSVETPAGRPIPDPATAAHAPGGIRETLHGMFG